MADEANKGGRPETTEEEKQEMLQKLEPYLRSGLSIRKALKEAQVPNSTFYDLMSRDSKFSEQIGRFRQYLSILLNSSIIKHLQSITRKQNENVPLTKEDISFLQWFATNSNLTREEFGERKDVGFYDPEAEIQRLARIMESDDDEGDDNGLKEE